MAYIVHKSTFKNTTHTHRRHTSRYPPPDTYAHSTATQPHDFRWRKMKAFADVAFFRVQFIPPGARPAPAPLLIGYLVAIIVHA